MRSRFNEIVHDFIDIFNVNEYTVANKELKFTILGKLDDYIKK